MKERSYRRRVSPRGLVPFEVRAKETDLWILAIQDLSQEALEEVLRLRHQLEGYIEGHPAFLNSYSPLPDDPMAPPVVRQMLAAALKTGVGPMAAVAGAIAEGVGSRLLQRSPEVVVENGGDVFIKALRTLRVAIYAGDSPLSMKIGLEIVPERTPLGVCTSSATIGHSESFGRADAVCVVARSCALADAAATALGNRVKGEEDLQEALEAARGIEGVEAVVIVLGEKLALWGDHPLVEV